MVLCPKAHPIPSLLVQAVWLPPARLGTGLQQQGPTSWLCTELLLCGPCSDLRVVGTFDRRLGHVTHRWGAKLSSLLGELSLTCPTSPLLYCKPVFSPACFVHFNYQSLETLCLCNH